MSILKDFVSKYSGKFHEGEFKSGSGSYGRYEYQQKKGIINFHGNKIYVGINEVGGATPTAEPFRMKLINDTHFKSTFLIQPRGYWARKIKKLYLAKKEVFKTNYRYKGSPEIIRLLLSSELFLSSVKDEFFWIQISEKHPEVIMITPERGYRDNDHLEKMAGILTEIKSFVN